jgi:thymidylate synthase
MELFAGDSVTEAWLLAARRLAKAPSFEMFDLAVEIANPLEEVAAIRRSLDRYLAKTGKQSIETVANTIFPRRLWRPALGRERLYATYARIVPKLHRFRGNHHGLYFERLALWPTTDGGRKNQIEDVITRLRSELARPNPLRFIYDLLVFSPQHDPRPLGFPCLSYMNVKLENGRLRMTAHYRNHYFVERAYGNYLGLARLQHFIAHEVGIEPGALVCVSGHAELDDHSRDMKQFLTELPGRARGSTRT